MSTPQQKTRVRIHGWTQRFKRFAFLLFLGAVLISLTAATANLAGVPNAAEAQPVVGATTHPIQYWIGCAPSMVTTTNLNYFKQQGFTAVCVVVPDSQTYQTQLTTIKSLNMLPIIDIEMPIWDGGQLQSTPISNFASYFQSLKTAGWQYVASEGGRSGDLEYMAHYFKGYVNFNCDQCGLWEGGYPVYTNSFTVANSWESYYPSEWQYIQNGSKQAAALGIQNGILAGTWANSGGDNQIYANSVSGSGTPSYLSMLNWSYANGIGFTSFHVWCGDNPDGLSQYQSLGFDKLVAAMQVYYPATTSASLAKGATGQPTQVTLTASSTTPAVNQSDTFTATLKSGSTALSSKSVTIYHYLNGVRYSDTTANTGTNGQLTLATKWTTPGTRTYYAVFFGDGSYQSMTSSAVTINVKAQPQLTLTASSTTPAVNQSDTFTATLKSGSTALSSKSVTIYHYLNGVRYSDTTANTGTNGQLTLATKWTTPGTRTYYAVFFGDGSYQSMTSSAVTINVKAQPQLTLTASSTTPAVNQSDTFTATLTSGGTALSGKNVTVYHYLDGVRYSDITKTTNAKGQLTLATKWTTPGTRTYYAVFFGDGSYQSMTSSAVTINVTNVKTSASTAVTENVTNVKTSASTAVTENVTNVAKMPTALTIAAPASALMMQNFTVNGTLSASAVGIGNVTTALQRSTDNATWTNVTTNVTNTTGGYQFSNNESAANTYYYRAVYDGNATYTNATSNTVNVTVAKMPTALTLTASNSTPAVNQSVTFNATLSNGTTPLSGENVIIYHYLHGVRYNDTTNPTNANGQITITTSGASTGQRTYYAAFAGDSTYQASTSSAVNVIVQ